MADTQDRPAALEQDAAEEIVSALYRGVLKREPEPSWMRRHAGQLKAKGIRAGLPELIGHFMGGATGLTDLANALLVNSSRVYLRNVNEAFGKQMPPGSKLLDVGAGNSPYRNLFGHVQYESADISRVKTEHGETTYVCDICERIPVPDDHFDYLLFNQTLEHVKEPARALDELFRVLRPGGTLLTTVPLFYEEHLVPYDFYRYTQFAHRYLFEKSGFRIEKIDWLEGFFGTCGYMLETIYRYAPSSTPGSGEEALWARSFLAVIKPLCLIGAGSFYRLDLTWKITNVGFPKNYVITARKPG